MLNRFPKTRAEWSAWAKEAEQKSPARFRFVVLALAAILMVAHYTIDELGYHPEVSLWKARAYWSGAWMYAAAPFGIWLAWRLVARASRPFESKHTGETPVPLLKKILKPILVMAVVLCASSALAYCVPNMLRSIEAMHLVRFDPTIEKWHWSTFRFYWRSWTPVVVVIGNLVLLWRWRAIVARSHEKAESGNSQSLLTSAATLHGRGKQPSKSVILKLLAIISAMAACGVTAFHWVLPRVPANQDAVELARNFLIAAPLRNDFDYLIQHSFSKGQSLAPLLTHLELANLQRQQFYSNLDDATFRAYVLSPEIAPLPLEEGNWRRILWENVYPRIRRESDPSEAAQIVVRFLRERVGIDSSYHYRVGVETIWTQQMTDEAGFERIYVAALRSVGIAARLDDGGQAELLEGNQWQPAPRVPISTFEEKKFPVPRNGLVNFRNWAGDAWQQ